MNDSLHILRALARHYERTQAGRTGIAERDLILPYEKFLADCDCRNGESRVVAEHTLTNAARGTDAVLKLETHRHDPRLIQTIRFPVASEQALYRLLGEPSPTEKRKQLAKQFAQAASSEIVMEWREAWVDFCG